MPKIEIKDGKTLRLFNVLSRKVPETELFASDKQIMMLHNWIKAKGYETKGPLIMYSSGIKGVDGDNKPIIDSKLMIQLTNEKIRLEIPYQFEKEIRIENCLMARFNDETEKLQFATMALALHAYENDIKLTGETYIIFIKEDGKFLLADVFMPVGNETADKEELNDEVV